MRIITGQARGRKLSAPQGFNTRPTSERVKESVFNIIQFDIEGRAALDLYCGSGQMGLEAVSRGAKSCLFVDSDRQAVSVTQNNIKACGFTDRCSVYQGDAVSALSRQGAGSAGLVFLDPPYTGKHLESALDAIFTFDILIQGGIIICESAREAVLPQVAQPYKMLKEYFYGKSKITTITRV